LVEPWRAAKTIRWRHADYITAFAFVILTQPTGILLLLQEDRESHALALALAISPTAPRSDAQCNAGTDWQLPALFHAPADPAHSRIEQAASYVYLGTTFHHSCSWAFHCDGCAADYRGRVAPNLVERGVGAFGVGDPAGAAV
jgi:hypothetical protein